MKYKVEVVIPRLLSGEVKGKIKDYFVDGNFISRDLKVGEYFNLMGGAYRIIEIIDGDDE
ncbi:MAG: hypothetical protein EOL97_11105 [Spirochaetia bacterium]|nr:hypothetical protein [Spirochaetia bacterium]